MEVLKVNSREFRDKQKAYLDLADNGKKVVIQRGRKQAYVLTPIDDDDLYFTPEMLRKIDASIQEAKEGKVKRFSNIEDLNTYLDSL